MVGSNLKSALFVFYTCNMWSVSPKIYLRFSGSVGSQVKNGEEDPPPLPEFYPTTLVGGQIRNSETEPPAGLVTHLLR